MYILFFFVKRFELSYVMDIALWKSYVLLLLSFWKRAIVSQTDIETVSKLTLGKLLRRRRGGAYFGFSGRIATVLN